LMLTRFIEVLPEYGVDDKLAEPQMIVPLRGTNHIILIDGEGSDVKAQNPPTLEITEVKNLIGYGPKRRLFRLKGKMLPGKTGTLVEARRGTAVFARLRAF